MVKKLTKNNIYTQYRTRLGILIVVLGAVLSFALGVGATIGLRSFSDKSTTEYKSIEITGSDGLIGLLGYDNPFQNANKIVYKITYNNTSHEDRFLQIKATGRANNPTQMAKNSSSIDLGAYTGTVYSEKKLVKAGTKEVFEMPLVEYTATPTKYVELEAFKSNTD
ncbi:MAG: hypothetical protein ABIQ04_03875 [Candidatus Saccharimonadales bacterium]